MTEKLNELMNRLAPILDGLETGQDCAEYAYAKSNNFQAMTYCPEAFEALKELPVAVSALQDQCEQMAAELDSSAALAEFFEEFQEGGKLNAGTCEGCGKPVTIGHVVTLYADVGEVHLDCENPYALPKAEAAGTEEDPKVYVMLGSPLMAYPAPLDHSSDARKKDEPGHTAKPSETAEEFMAEGRALADQLGAAFVAASKRYGDALEQFALRVHQAPISEDMKLAIAGMLMRRIKEIEKELPE